MSKKIKMDKETSRLVDVMTDLLKKTRNGYKFKNVKKKSVKKAKRLCVHWMNRKGKPVPMVHTDENNPTNWKCICGASFPIKPLAPEDYRQTAEEFLSHVDQISFWAVMMGGDKGDVKIISRLKQIIPEFMKIEKEVVKAMNKRHEFEERKNNTDAMGQFDSYSGFNYNL